MSGVNAGGIRVTMIIIFRVLTVGLGFLPKSCRILEDLQ